MDTINQPFANPLKNRFFNTTITNQHALYFFRRTFTRRNGFA